MLLLLCLKTGLRHQNCSLRVRVQVYFAIKIRLLFSFPFALSSPVVVPLLLSPIVVGQEIPNFQLSGYVEY